jgi:hypothetical protein
MLLIITLGYLGVTTPLLLGLLSAAAHADRTAPAPKRGSAGLSPMPWGVYAR